MVVIVSTWSMVRPCNMHIDRLAREAEAGANAAGGKALIFGTITGLTRGWALRKGQAETCHRWR